VLYRKADVYLKLITDMIISRIGPNLTKEKLGPRQWLGL